MTTIKIEHLNKHFHKHNVLNDINLTFKPDRIYGLLGRNGAGKSTLLSIITGLNFTSSGNVMIDGESVNDNCGALSDVFMMSETNMYPDSMKVRDIIKNTAKLYYGFDKSLANRLVREFGVDIKTSFSKLSTGYHSIVKDIIALCVPVNVVIFDEPTLGLDANHRELFYSELIQSYSDRPRTMIISTHLIDEIANLVSDVVIIDDGRIIVDGENEELLKNAHEITGPENELDAYCDGLNVIGSKKLANLKTNYVYGQLNDDRKVPDTVSINGMDLQTLFIYLTSRDEELFDEEETI
ncbi:ABC transporter ATP-binding protein [Nicoliella spurrieriana]|uniref:ABC transporter ATP-binding protein n=1 Tax=Nicoliella spurrieriana TaxID=2925830 RepID=A0A976RS10_9LACO|nr:ABC transporter ATP-binding protein [Nicoliella spurrieriana]UQS86825.1 ABC transporter ATP-binding protein [Nicoliella spurrieriana]